MAREFRVAVDSTEPGRILQCSHGGWQWLDVALFDIAVPDSVVQEIVSKLND